MNFLEPLKVPAATSNKKSKHFLEKTRKDDCIIEPRQNY